MAPVTTLLRSRPGTVIEQAHERWRSRALEVESTPVIRAECNSLPRPEQLSQPLPDLNEALEAQVLERSGDRVLLRVYEPDGGTVREEGWRELSTPGLRFDRGDWVLLWEGRGLILPEGDAPHPSATPTRLPEGMIPAALREEPELSEEEALRQLLLATGTSEEVVERSLATFRSRVAVGQL